MLLTEVWQGQPVRRTVCTGMRAWPRAHAPGRAYACSRGKEGGSRAAGRSRAGRWAGRAGPGRVSGAAVVEIHHHRRRAGAECGSWVVSGWAPRHDGGIGLRPSSSYHQCRRRRRSAPPATTARPALGRPAALLPLLARVRTARHAGARSHAHTSARSPPNRLLPLPHLSQQHPAIFLAQFMQSQPRNKPTSIGCQYP